MHIVPAQFQSQPYQVSPMRTPAQALGGFIGSGFTTATSANERTAPDSILTGSLPTDGRDEWRAAGHDDGISIIIYFRDKPGIEGVDTVFSLHFHGKRTQRRLLKHAAVESERI